MTGPLENSVTLEDVVAIVAAKRVPLAAELAGYLALEMAEGAGSAPGTIDPANVYISDEGSVALVRTKKEGDAEASIRALLAKLLEAGGTSTPALGVAAKKAPSGGPSALARELEAALIPVNRAAGRRALARLAREVKRVTHGVGRNASIPPAERGPRASAPDAAPRRPSGPSFSEEEVPTTAKRAVEPEVIAETRRSDVAAEERTSAPTIEISNTDAKRLRSLPEAVRDSSRPPPPPVAAVAEPSAKPPEVDDLHPVDEESRPKDDVDALLSSFAVSEQKEDKGLARELKAMVGVEPTPPPVHPADTSIAKPDDADVEALLSLSKATPAPPTRRERRSSPDEATHAAATRPKPPAAPAVGAGEGAMREREHSYADERSLPTSPSQRRKKQARKTSALDVVLGVVLAVLLGAGGYLVYVRYLHPAPAPAPAPSAAAPIASAPEPKRTCKGTLTVQNVPDKSEVLLRVGQAPVEIDRMPVGTRLEFVATADGYAPKRTVVPGGAAWEKGPDGKPRYELAVQLDPSRAKGGVDPWPPAEPGSSAGGEGAPGVVRVVSSPKGAEVWLLVGLGPEAVIERLPCSGDTQVLVAGSGTFRKRLVVRESDFADVPGAPGQKSAKVSVK